MAVGFGGAKVEPASVQMDDRLVRRRIRRVHPNSWYAGEEIGFERHVVALQNAFHKGIELCTRFDFALDHSFASTRCRANEADDLRVFWIKRMGRDEIHKASPSHRTMLGGSCKKKASRKCSPHLMSQDIEISAFRFFPRDREQRTALVRHSRS